MKRFLYIVYLFAMGSSYTQENLVMNRATCEALFLKENILLLAQNLQISQSEALVEQAKSWPNPTLTLDQVNLWATTRQTNNQETTPALFGNFGRDQQFSVEFEQLIITAGKRKKLIDIEQLNVQKSKTYFAELLHNLKIEFRHLVTELETIQELENLYQIQIQSITTLTTAYAQHVEQGNVAKGEYIRLKALELQLLGELNDLKSEKNKVQTTLKSLMHLPPKTDLIIQDMQKEVPNIELWTIDQLITIAYENRPDIELSALNKQLADKQYAYQQAQRMPDLTLKAVYDRNGSTMLDFIGFGIGIDLPLFNKNKGNIRYADKEREITNLLAQQTQNKIENQVVEAYQNARIAIEFGANIEANYEQTLDELFAYYTINFQQRNINILEFMDFMEAYKENKKTILESKKNIRIVWEELQYAVGTELN